jgi:hypothetical protein
MLTFKRPSGDDSVCAEATLMRKRENDTMRNNAIRFIFFGCLGVCVFGRFGCLGDWEERFDII